MKEFIERNEWALILGGSSGLGLATAKKLAQHGLNICIVHRNPRLHQEAIAKEFEIIKQEGVQFQSFNVDAFKPDMRNQVINELKVLFGETHKIKTLVHSVAKGNLKPMVSDVYMIGLNRFLIRVYFQRMHVLLVSQAKEILRPYKTMPLFLQQKLPLRPLQETLLLSLHHMELKPIVFKLVLQTQPR